MCQLIANVPCSIQWIQVAEQCILKWLKNYVEPLVKKQQKEAEEVSSFIHCYSRNCHHFPQTTPEISSRRPHAGDKSSMCSR